MPLDSRPWAIGGVLDVPRSLLFYVAFYVGGAPIIAASGIAMLVHQRTFRRIVRLWCGYHRACARIFLGIRLRLEGAPLDRAVLYAVRHESFFEAIDLPRLLPRPAIVAKAELMRIPVWGMAARHWGTIAVRRDQGAKALRAMVREAQGLVAQGRPLAIFPEGTRVRSGQAVPLQSGFAALYKLLGMEVVPVAVNSGRLYHRWFKRPGTITYRFGRGSIARRSKPACRPRSPRSVAPNREHTASAAGGPRARSGHRRRR
jgi:1-acyl-sn-glycerol-3-phosphate acyltransferase